MKARPRKTDPQKKKHSSYQRGTQKEISDAVRAAHKRLVGDLPKSRWRKGAERG